jgi:hypothetical protein
MYRRRVASPQAGSKGGLLSIPIDAEIEAAVVAMRSIRTKGAKVHEEVLRAYARAAVEAAERARLEDFQRRARLNNMAKPPDEGPERN